MGQLPDIKTGATMLVIIPMAFLRVVLERERSSLGSALRARVERIGWSSRALHLWMACDVVTVADVDREG